MKYFTKENTEGFAQVQLDELNETARIFISDPNDHEEVQTVTERVLRDYTTTTAEAMAELTAAEAMAEADDICTSQDQFWNIEATVFTFQDESKLLIMSDGHVSEIERVDAEAEHDGDTLSAECPHCAIVDGYVSTGEHEMPGIDVVRCSVCGTWFEIEW